MLVKDVSDELSKRFAVAMFAGFDDGVKMVAASNLASVCGAGQVAIPLAIAGLIIFNTMMGSIAERRREIHVYTSLGLAPAARRCAVPGRGDDLRPDRRGLRLRHRPGRGHAHAASWAGWAA